MIHIYTGNGKGKTTSALGLIIRAMGHNWRCCLIQFMKNDPAYGEIQFLSQQQNIEIFQYGTDHFVYADAPAAEDIAQAEAAWEKACEVLLYGQYDLIVLDEINVAVYMNLLKVEKQLALLPLAEKCELVMTGRYAAAAVISAADLVTEMQEIKHYFETGLQSREGIEF